MPTLDELNERVRGRSERATTSSAAAIRAEHDALDDYADFPVTRWTAAPDLRLRAYELRDRISAHGAAYVVLAEALDCPVVTRDERLARAVGAIATVQVL